MRINISHTHLDRQKSARYCLFELLASVYKLTGIQLGVPGHEENWCQVISNKRTATEHLNSKWLIVS